MIIDEDASIMLTLWEHQVTYFTFYFNTDQFILTRRNHLTTLYDPLLASKVPKYATFKVYLK